MSAAEDIRRLEAQVVRGKDADARARETDAARHLRKAIDLLEGCIAPSPRHYRAAALLVEAADILTGPEDA